MTPEEQAHMKTCIIEFSELMEKKYIRGQQEHSGSLWLKPQTNNIVEEVVDLAHYVMTKRQQEGILRSLVEAALKHGVRPVIGTSGVPEETMTRLRHGCAEQGLGAVVASNFAIGAVMLMYMARLGARYFESAEIIEEGGDGGGKDGSESSSDAGGAAAAEPEGPSGF